VLDLLHLHGFKCAGSSLIWSLHRHYGTALGYVEHADPGSRLPWETLNAAEQIHAYRAVTSHLITLPPSGQLARLKVAFVREPIARLASAYRYQRDVTKTEWVQKLDFRGYLKHLSPSGLSNYQTRHLSPQEEADWSFRNGWGARPELIDFDRPDLFVGVVERYDDSCVVLEALLEGQGTPLDLSYPGALNTNTAADADKKAEQIMLQTGEAPMTELDRSLLGRAQKRLDRHLASIPDLERRRTDFQRRCAALIAHPPQVLPLPPAQWLYLQA